MRPVLAEDDLMKARRRAPALQAERPVILAVSGSAAIEVRCRNASVRRKITPTGRESGKCRVTIDRLSIAAHGSPLVRNCDRMGSFSDIVR
jgi:hypothetical protein